MTNRTVMRKAERMSLAFSAALLILASDMVMAGSLTEDLGACAVIGDDSERLDCYDGLANRTLPPTPTDNAAAVQPESKIPAQATAPPDLSSEQLFGLGADEIRSSYEADSGTGDMKELRATVTEVHPAGPGRVLVVLDNGQTWRQVNTTNLKLKAGDAITVHKAAFGSFKMKKVGSSRAMRVRREK